MKQRASDIPPDAIEVEIREYRQEGSLVTLRVTECILDTQVVGQRAYNSDGSLRVETPLKDGRKHGREYIWNELGSLESVEPYVEGKIHSLRDNLPHGFEWWLKADQHFLWHEQHWQEGKVHGIERMWNDKGRLKRGYPKYWIQNQAVRKRTYLKAAEQDKSLPKFREKDNLPQRRFPNEIENLLSM